MKYLQKNEDESQKRVFRLIKIALCLLVLVFILEIWMVNRLSTYGKQIQNIKEAQGKLILENQILENSVAQNVSLKKIETRVQSFGFHDIKDLEYIKSSGNEN